MVVRMFKISEKLAKNGQAKRFTFTIANNLRPLL